jgi:phage tail-like protein
MQATRIKELLPAVFQQAVVPGQPISAYLDVMELFHASIEEKLADLDRFFDPRRAPDEFVRFLAAWVDVDVAVSTGRMRELIAGFVELLSMRGTRQGLILLLERATGLQGFEVRENPPDATGVPRQFHIEVSAPAALQPHRNLLLALIERAKPAYVTSSLAFEPA